MKFFTSIPKVGRDHTRFSSIFMGILALLVCSLPSSHSGKKFPDYYELEGHDLSTTFSSGSTEQALIPVIFSRVILTQKAR